MGIFSKEKFASNNQVWETPDDVFLPLQSEFNFTLDVAANAENAKAEKYFDEEIDGLTQDWTGTCWMNPPFNNLKAWVKKAYEEGQKGATVVCFVPAGTNTNWFHDYCFKGEVRFLRGRPKFNNVTHGLPQPLAIVIFRGKSSERAGN
jgi:phage N-6-adenine-methyltransferase